jgi:hypothetical protein
VQEHLGISEAAVSSVSELGAGMGVQDVMRDRSSGLRGEGRPAPKCMHERLESGTNSGVHEIARDMQVLFCLWLIITVWWMSQVRRGANQWSRVVG